MRYTRSRSSRSGVGKNDRVSRRRGGYAPVVSSAIMLSAVAVMGPVLLIWANTGFMAQQQSIDNYFEKRSNSVKEAVVIEDVWFESSPSSVEITLRNVGAIAVSIEKVTIASNLYWTGPSVLGIKQASTIQVNFAWTPGQEYDIVVTTERGSAVRGIWKA